MKLEYVGLPGTYSHYRFFTTGAAGQEPVGEYELRWPKDENTVVEVWNFEVYPKFRGKGYAKRMMKGVIKRAQEKGTWPDNNRLWLRLYVKQRNYKAIKLYKAFGFVVAARHDHSEDFVMTRFIDGH